MTPQEFETAYLAQTIWRLALSDSVDELIAVGCTLRNWVIPKMGKIAKYKTYPEACADFLRTYPLRDFPNMTEDALVSTNGLLSVIDGIYDCSYPDLTATQTTPGALYFARAHSVNPDDWRYGITHNHQLLGTFGSQQFWA
jgi:hypothetical protein